MAVFFRINNNTLFSAGEVKRLGFTAADNVAIPDEYLSNLEFVIMRTCHGIGDWCLISSMPRLLKSKYPNCKVLIPSSIMMKSIFGSMLNQWGYGTYDSSLITQDIFKNNPYIDGFIDQYTEEVFHDHYRIYDDSNDEIPLVEQMLKFWQFKDEDIIDSTPDIFFSKEEIEKGRKLIASYENFGYINVSSTYGSTADSNLLLDKIKEYGDINWFYYGEKALKETNLNFIKNYVEVKPMNLSIREQMYIKTQAKVNIGNETGMMLWGAKYSETYVLGNKVYGSNHGGKNEGKPRKRPFKSGNFVKKVNYLR
jgi:hypothetical protein|tara:strand:+ start:341 stop:1270 length:930 start_codon:yes stop_codon:yes gene_type:complete